MNIKIILLETSHPGNIGAVARAMKNMGLRDLALVEPWYFPHADATARASGAEDILASAQVVDNLDDAIADCVYVAGASARARSIDWPMMEPRECAVKLLEESRAGKVAVLFGPEKSGLKNEHLDRCNTLLTIPTDPGFSSLNLAMAVQIMTYELRVTAGTMPAPVTEAKVPLASAAELEHFYEHLETVLSASGFLDPDNPRHLMRRLRRLFARAEPDKNEINILRGILTSLDPARGHRD